MVGLIPCRKGSKRVPNKTFLDLNGRPVIWYTLKAAEESCLKEYYISTDYLEDDFYNEGINLAEFKKLKFLKRPDAYCKDLSLYTEYIWHFVDAVVGMEFKSVCLLQPTCPLRTSTHINEAIGTYKSGSLPCLVSAYPVVKGQLYNSNFTSLFGTDYIKDECAYVRNSSIYIFPITYFINHKTIYATPTLVYPMDMFSSVDINDYKDMEICRKLLNCEVK